MGLLAAFLLAGCAATPIPDAETAREALLAAERSWLDAFPARDEEALDRVLAEEFVITYANGHTADKADNLAYVRNTPPPDPAPILTTEGTRVRVYGDAAVLTGVYRQSVGEETIMRARYTDTYVYRDGRWQVVASQLTRLEF